VDESCVDAAGQSLHAGRRAKCNHSDNQSVFNQILTIFPLNQALQSFKELAN
jgi:hypothetical protein